MLLDDIFRGRWSSDLEDEKTCRRIIGLWERVLADLTAAQIAKGMRRLERTRAEWPPTPGQFRSWCIPSERELSIPDRNDAWHLAHSPEEEDMPVVVEHMRKVMRIRPGTRPDMARKDEFYATYARVSSNAAAGLPLAHIPIEKPRPKVLPKEEGAKRLAEIRKMIKRK